MSLIMSRFFPSGETNFPSFHQEPMFPFRIVELSVKINIMQEIIRLVACFRIEK